MALSAGALVLMVMMPVAGGWFSRMDARLMVSIGFPGNPHWLSTT